MTYINDKKKQFFKIKKATLEKMEYSFPDNHKLIIQKVDMLIDEKQIIQDL